MKLTKPGPRRQKILLYYTLTVVVPGIVLGSLAYRGIPNDQALREKENMKRLEINSRTLFSAIDSSLVYFVNGMTSGSFLPGIRENAPYILALFTEDPGGGVNLLAHRLLYLPSELFTFKLDYDNLTSSLREGQRLEFMEHSTGGGLVRFDDKTWTVYDTYISKIPKNTVMAVAIDSYGSKWIGGFGGLCVFREGGVILPK